MTETGKKNRHGDLGTFVIRVQQHQNSTFQGRITWVEEDKTTYFRSMWEMNKLIEEGIISTGEIEQEKLPDWE